MPGSSISLTLDSCISLGYTLPFQRAGSKHNGLSRPENGLQCCREVSQWWMLTEAVLLTQGSLCLFPVLCAQ